MKGFLRTLYGKISIIFLLVIFLLGALQIFISVRTSLNYSCESSQKINFSLAENCARKFEPMVKDTLNAEKIRPVVRNLLSLNPSIDVYLLDIDGYLLGHFNEPEQIQRKIIDIAPIHAFLEKNAYDNLPIFGEDPLAQNKKQIFSAAEMFYEGGKRGYVYVMLASARSALASEGIRDSYILSASAMALTVTLLFGAIIGLILFFLLTKRLHSITHAVRIFERGQYDQRIPVNSNDEVGELANAFNHMAGEIQKNMRALEKNDRMRRELIANVSHDLRSPLASIQGYVETVLMKDDSLDNKERRRFLEIIFRNITNLNTLVHQLFELSKLDALQTKPKSEPFSLAELVQDVVLKFQPQAENKNIHLLTKLKMNLPFVYADIGLIERVISNLIDNALQHTKEKGKITVELQQENDSIRVTVSDSGSGIPEEDLPFIFKRFYRVEKSRSRDTKGSGLGLAIAKKIIEAHGSTITVKSTVNVGTSFSFKLKIFTRSLLQEADQKAMQNQESGAAE